MSIPPTTTMHTPQLPRPGRYRPRRRSQYPSLQSNNPPPQDPQACFAALYRRHCKHRAGPYDYNRSTSPSPGAQRRNTGDKTPTSAPWDPDLHGDMAHTSIGTPLSPTSSCYYFPTVSQQLPTKYHYVGRDVVFRHMTKLDCIEWSKRVIEIGATAVQ